MNRDELMSRILDAMSAVKRGVYSHMQSNHDDINLSHSQMELLFTIKHMQPVGGNQLAKQLYLTAGAVSQVSENLVQQGLVERHDDPSDRRKQFLRLTTAGEDRVKAILQQRHELFREIMALMTTAELETWLNVQQKIISHLNTNPQHPNKGARS